MGIATGRNGGNIKAVPEHTVAELGKEKARDIVPFTLANLEALIKLNDGLSHELQKAGEVRLVETMNVFTTQAGFDEFSAAVREFDDGFPDFRGRGRLIQREELKSVSLTNTFVRGQVLMFHRSMGYTTQLGAISLQLVRRGLIDLSLGYFRIYCSSTTTASA